GPRRDRGWEVLDRAGSSTRDDRHRTDLAHGGDELQVEARLRAIGVDRVHKELARTALDRLAGPLQAIALGLRPAAVCRHDEAGRGALGSLEVEREHERL